MRLRYAVLVLMTCAAVAWLTPLHAQASRYLFVWAGDEDAADSDFLAVVDVQPRPGQYGRVVATLPVGEKDLFAHHTEHQLGPNARLFASGFAGNANFLFDLRDPLRPRIVTRFGSVAGFSYLHSFVRLPNGHVIATFQGRGPESARPGGLAELDADGRLVRAASVADPTADEETLRPYSLEAVPALDRLVVAHTVMRIPAEHAAAERTNVLHEHRGNQIQVWRLSDLSLIKTIRLPGVDGPNEPRVLADGRTVLVSTSSCNIYQVEGLASATPSVRLVHAGGGAPNRCNVPVVVGNFWVVSNTGAGSVASLDVRDLSRVREVSRLAFAGQRPHWMATDGQRIIIVNEETIPDRLMWMATIDPDTGVLAHDERFRNEGSSAPVFTFDGPTWPHGRTGKAVPHGAVFSR